MNELLLVLGLIHGADSVSTVMGHNRGAHEMNTVLTNNMAVNVPLKAAFAAGEIVALKVLEHWSPKAAKIGAVIGIGVETGVTGHNVGVYVSLGRKR